MKRIIPVPQNTLPYKCGERYMACEITEKDNHHYVIEHCIEFFKNRDNAVDYGLKHYIYVPLESEMNKIESSYREV